LLYLKYKAVDTGMLTMMLLDASLEDSPDLLLFLKKNY